MISDKFFNFESCSLVYQNLVDEEGNALTLTTKNEARPREIECDVHEYSRYHFSMSTIITYLGSEASLSLSPKRMLFIIDLTQTIANSQAWRKCLDFAYSFLDVTQEPYEFTTTDCLLYDDDPLYQEDPCCNTDLQLSKCCVASPFSYNISKYNSSEVTDLRIREKCNAPGCVAYPLDILAFVSGFDSSHQCAVDREKMEADPIVLKRNYEKCIAAAFGVSCYHDSSCSVISDSSVCNPESNTCVIPCFYDSEGVGICYNGKCSRGICVDLSTNYTVQTNAAYRCSMDIIDPYIAIIAQEAIQNSPIEGTIQEKFLELVTDFTCVAGSDAVPGDFSSPSECPLFCKPTATLIGTKTDGVKLDGSPFYITEESCRDIAHLDYKDGYCAYVINDFTAFTLSHPDLCQIRTVDSEVFLAGYSEDLCINTFGGDKWISVDETGYRTFGVCFQTSIKNEDDCINSIPCLGTQYKGVACHSYCMNPTLITEDDCVAEQSTWYWFPGHENVLGTCVVETKGANGCWDAGNDWITGKEWYPAKYNTKETCPQNLCFGHYTGAGFFEASVEDCSQKRCRICSPGSNEPHCLSEEACTAMGSCNNAAGCPLRNEILDEMGANPPCIWNPIYCVAQYDQDSCTPNVLTPGWWDALTFPTEESCLGFAEVCNSGVGFINREGVALPIGFTYRNKEECELCGGKIQSWFSWGPAKWESDNVVITPQWIDHYVEPTLWRPIFNKNKFTTILEQARAKRYSSVITSELHCLYGIESSLLATVGCLCTDDNTASLDMCKKDFTAKSASATVVSVISLCKGFKPVKASVHNDAVTFTTNNFNFEDAYFSSCATMDVSIVSHGTLTMQRKDITNSLSLVTKTAHSKLSSAYVYNKNDVAVGNILADGYRISISGNLKVSGVTMCFTFPETVRNIEKLHIEYTLWGLAYINSGEEEGTLNILPETIVEVSETVACTDMIISGVDYFPVLLTGDWEDATIYQTWSSAEKGLMIFCIIAFLFLLIWVSVSFVLRLYDGGFDRNVSPEVCLMSLIVLSALGASYQIGALTGLFQDNNLNPLFTDLPQLCLLTCILITSSTWRFIIFRGSMTNKIETTAEKVAPFLFLLSLYLIFIGLSIASAVSDEQKIFTCSTTDADLKSVTTSEAISTSYKAIFAFYTFMIAISFVHSGIQVIHLLSDT
eukprot:TRINITY_DN2304_c0_g1_i3.p1 TRINITY_DN2304_c0_g1~~TRINITY_DN2304_c0_g1_i3.p1  ORF type:complete len:1179 (+),score=216.64 TRINITY_DN2304_c0_g1_i3:516-4052(+)